MTVLGYARVSTEEQARDGVSLNEQRTRIAAYCEAHGLALLRVEEDPGVSGKTMDRPGFARVLDALRRGEANGLVAVKLDRLTRSTRDMLDLVGLAEREGWALHSIGERLDTSSAIGRFVVTIFAGLAQLEREQIGERTKAALGELRRQGRRYSGRAPFGFRFEDGRLVEVPGEREHLERARDLRERGLSLEAVAARLGENPRTGRRWDRSGLWRALSLTPEAGRMGGVTPSP